MRITARAIAARLSLAAVAATLAMVAGSAAAAADLDGPVRMVPPAMAAPDSRPAPWRYGDPAHADLTGIWEPARGQPPNDGKIPLSKPYAAKLDETRRRIDAGRPPADSVTRCMALSVPRYMTMAFELIQTPGQVTMVSSILTDVRRIYLDGQGHTPDAEPSFNGDSIGRWDGDTLVVETNNLHAGTMDEYGIPYSDKLVVAERFRRVAPNRLEVTTTLTDPDALTRPWTYVRQFGLSAPGVRQEEYRCENNRNINADGEQGAVVGRKRGE